MRFCPHCLRSTDQGEFCIHCGKELKTTTETGQLPAGTLLNRIGGNSYQLGAVLGQGGFGITYAAKNLETGERVAVKEYYPSHCAIRSRTTKLVPMTGQDDSYHKGLNGFLTEARMLASAGTLPCVVSVLDYFEANGTAYLVMEYVEGSALSNLLKKKGPMRADVLLPILQPLMNDLEIIHRAGIIHRDISPDNLILTPDGTLKLLDFGSARSMQGDKTMTMLLKAGFSPIEQYQSHGQGPWTDVYALCATVYYCLTGTIPPISVDRLTQDTIVLPNVLGAGLTPAQERALLHGLQVLQPHRTSTMQDLRRELFAPAPQPVPSGRPVSRPVPTPQPAPSGRPISRPAPVPTPQPVPPVQPKRGDNNKRKPLIVLLIILSAALLVIIGVVGAALLSDSQETKKSVSDNSTGKDREESSYNGFQYTIEDDSCTITGYDGGEMKLEIPESIDGVAVKVIAEDSFADNVKVTRVDIPNGITVMKNAFKGCTKLRFLAVGNNCVLKADAFADCTGLEVINVEAGCSADKDAFSGCSNLRAASYVGSNIFSGMALPSDFCAYKDKMDIGVGELYGVDVTDDVIYAQTYDEEWVVMDFPNNASAITLDSSVVWVHEDALDGCSSDIEITPGDNTIYPYELFDDASWDIGEWNTLSAAWWYSCVVCKATEEDSGVVVRPDLDLVRATMVRAEELSESDSFDRPDGSEWGTVLDEHGISWQYGTCQKNSFSSGGDASDTAISVLEDFSAKCAEAIADPDFSGQHYEIAAATFYNVGDTYYFHGMMILQ